MKRSPFRYPCRSRKDMADYIEDVGGYHSWNQTTQPLAWNVKVYPDLDFDRLFNVWIEHGGGTEDARKCGRALARYRRTAEAYYDREYATESGRALLFDIALEDARRALTEDEAFCSLWNGQGVEAMWEFVGRSGGYAALTRFEGACLSGLSSEALGNELRQTGDDMVWSFPELRTLYRFCVEMNHLLTPKKASDEVEYLAAFIVFNEVEDNLEP